VKNLEQVRAAQAEPVDYLGAGPVYPSATKPGAGAPWGLDLLRQACAASRLPLLAIGGITAQNAAQVRACGVAGIAAVSAIAGAEDPEAAAKGLLGCQA
jgi:thiamine-phosphate pyrophosphorylase